MPEAPWFKPTGVEAVVSAWLESGVVRTCLAAERLIPAQVAQVAPIPEGVSPALRDALTRRGVDSLYTHQVSAVTAAMAGRHVVVATPTASGKSLCLHLPVLNAISRDPHASALYLYPTKALAQDQARALNAFNVKNARLAIYDGDTPREQRSAIRRSRRSTLETWEPNTPR